MPAKIQKKREQSHIFPKIPHQPNLPLKDYISKYSATVGLKSQPNEVFCLIINDKKLLYSTTQSSKPSIITTNSFALGIIGSTSSSVVSKRQV